MPVTPPSPGRASERAARRRRGTASRSPSDRIRIGSMPHLPELASRTVRAGRRSQPATQPLTSTTKSVPDCETAIRFRPRPPAPAPRCTRLPGCGQVQHRRQRTRRAARPRRHEARRPGLRRRQVEDRVGTPDVGIRPAEDGQRDRLATAGLVPAYSIWPAPATCVEDPARHQESNVCRSGSSPRGRPPVSAVLREDRDLAAAPSGTVT